MADGCLNGKVIYYRGVLKSCNYHCGYCPFGKTLNPVRPSERDRAALKRFCDKVTESERVGVMFLPYGEALIHPYYLEQIGRLSRESQVRFVACQTNLSFAVNTLANHAVRPDKLKLWCSFHPSQTSVDAFTGQCQRLMDYGVEFCVGAVGDPEAIGVIRQLRSRLPQDTYLWINDMDGKRKAYTEAEREAFTAIDPLFGLELEKRSADLKVCRAGDESLYVDGKGDVYACNISRGRMGNVYDGEVLRLSQRVCKAKACSCYLAYSNRTDIGALDWFGGNRPFRIPVRLSGKAWFFDVDGTLAGSDGVVPEARQDAVRRLAGTSEVYLATSLPYREARRICGPLWDCLSGGVFAEGADIRIFDSGYRRIVPLGDIIPIIASGRVREYREGGVLYKLTISGTDHRPDDFPEFHAVYEDDRLGITGRETGKLNGIREICAEKGVREQDVVVVGNSRNDIGMLKAFTHSVAVADGSEEAKKAAAYVCSVEQLGQTQELGRR